MFCVNCGNQIEDESSFCPFCGTRLSGLEETDISEAHAQIESDSQLQVEIDPQPQVNPVTSAESRSEDVPAVVQPEIPTVSPVPSPVVPDPAASVTPQEVAPFTKELGAKRIPIIIAIAVVVVCVIAALIMGALGVFGLGEDGSFDQGSATDDGIAVKEYFADYDWDELEAIAQQISAASSDEEALEIAGRYKLVDPSGKISIANTKSIQLNDGTTVAVWIAGFRHDDKSDGSGKAGITFVMSAPEAFHSMNPNDANAGGWEDSRLREWMSKEGFELLPTDLSDKIIGVRKLTNNIGGTKSANAVSMTSDKLWVPSAVEIFGPISTYQGENAYCNDILNSEGTRYRIFGDGGVSATKKNPSLGMQFDDSACAWWLRSPLPSSETTFCTVNEYGSFATALSGGSYGVVAGFCIG